MSIPDYAERHWHGIVTVLAMIFTFLFFYPRHPIGRFQAIAGAPNLALDTKSGQLCYSFDSIGNGSDKIPLCKELK